MPQSLVPQPKTVLCAGIIAVASCMLAPGAMRGDSPDAPVFVRSIGSQGRLGTLNGPAGLAHVKTESGSIVYVVDSGNARIQVLSAAREVIGAFGFRGDVERGGFWVPCGVAADADGDTLFVTDRRHRVVMVFRPTPECMEGRSSCFQSAFSGWGRGPGQLLDPTGIAVGPDGRVYVADAGAHDVEVFTETGSHIMTIGSVGVERGQLMHPSDVAVAPDGSIWVADRNNDRLSVFRPDGEFVVAHRFGDRLHYPVGIEFAPDGTFAVADYDTGYGRPRVRLFTAERKELGASTIGCGEGRRDDYPPMGVTILPELRVLLTAPTDYDSGLAEMPPGGGEVEWWLQRGQAIDQFSAPWAVAVDPQFLAVSDGGNARVTIWKGPDAEKVQNVLGGPLAPQFDFVDPRGIAVWRYGPQVDEAVILVADPGRNQIYRSTPNGRRLDSWGSNDPTSDREGFRQPMDVSVSLDGTAFIADAGNDRIVVRGPDGGVLNTIGPFPNGPYELDRPASVAAGQGNLVYVLEDGRSRVQAFTVAGERVDEWPGADGDDAPPGRPWMPVDLAFYGDYLYILENDRVQQGEGNHVRVEVFRPLPGIPLEECLVTVFASTLGAGDGMVWDPRGVAAVNDWVAVADTGNNRVQIYRWMEDSILPPPIVPTSTPLATATPPPATPTEVPPTATDAPPTATWTVVPSATPPLPATDPPASALPTQPPSPTSAPSQAPATARPTGEQTGAPTDAAPDPTATPTTQSTDRLPRPTRRVCYLPVLMR